MSEVVNELLFAWKCRVMGAWKTILAKSLGFVKVLYFPNSIK